MNPSAIPKLKELGKLLSTLDEYLIITHENPDGDAVGSLAGLFSSLIDNGKKAVALFPEDLPSRHLSLLNGIKYQKHLETLKDFKTIICLDISIPERASLAKHFKILEAGIPLINIDHHPDNKIFGQHNFVFPDASATGEIIFKALRSIPDWKISNVTAQCLLSAIICDTGAFRFENTCADTFRTAAELMELDADCSAIMNNIYFSKPMNYVLFEANILLNRLKTDFSNKFVWTYFDDDILKNFGLEKKDTEDLIDAIRAINGVIIAAVLYKSKDGFKVSLRSKGKDISVGTIARWLGGGGHEMASGCTVKTDKLELAEKELKQKVGMILNEAT